MLHIYFLEHFSSIPSWSFPAFTQHFPSIYLAFTQPLGELQPSPARVDLWPSAGHFGHLVGSGCGAADGGSRRARDRFHGGHGGGHRSHWKIFLDVHRTETRRHIYIYILYILYILYIIYIIYIWYYEFFWLSRHESWFVFFWKIKCLRVQLGWWYNHGDSSPMSWQKFYN